MMDGLNFVTITPHGMNADVPRRILSSILKQAGLKS